MRKAGLVVLSSGLALLAACERQDPILPGDRVSVLEVLETRRLPEQVEPGARAFAAPRTQANANWAQSPVSPGARIDNAAWDGALEVLWSRPVGQGDTKRARLLVDPVVGDGRIFVMDSANTLRALSTDGTELWTREVTPVGDEARAAQGGGFALADGVLYVATGFGRLEALEAATGALLWSQKLGAAATGAPSVAGDLVYVTSVDATAWAVETINGRVRWRVEGVSDTNNMAGAPAPALSRDAAVFSFGSGGLQAVFRQGAYPMWSADLSGRRTGVALAQVNDLTGAPVIAGNRVFAGNTTGRLAAFGLRNGEPLWSLSEGAMGPVWPAGGSVFFVSDRAALIRADAETGAVIWRQALPLYEETKTPVRTRETAYVQYGPILAGGRLVVAGGDGLLRTFAPEDGRLLAETAIPGGATTRPAVAGGVLYVVSSEGVLYALR